MNKFILNENRFIYLGKTISDKLHKHHYIEILYNNSKKIDIQINNTVLTGSCFIIDSDISHRCLSLGVEVCIQGIDPESSLGVGLKQHYLYGQDYHIFCDDEFINLDYDFFSQNLIELFNLPEKQCEIYPVVKKAIQYLSENISEKIYISNIADHVLCSESYLQHLFKEQINIPLNNYIQLLRVKKIFEMLDEGKTLNDCVVNCGFTDYSHLNRVFKKMLGIAPSLFKKNSIIIQVNQFAGE